MSKKLNRTAQAARDAFIQRKVDEAVAPWKGMVAHDKLISDGLKADLWLAEARLAAEERNHRSTKRKAAGGVVSALLVGLFLGVLGAYHSTMSARYPAFITPPKDTPIVVYTENGWHQGYYDTNKGAICSMDNGQRILNATSWMKP